MSTSTSAVSSSKLLDMLDLPTAIRHALAGIRPYRGTEARIKGVFRLLVAAGLGPLVWYFDIQPTQQWIGPISGDMVQAMPGVLALLAPLFGVLIHLLPSLFETVLPRGVIFADLLTYSATVFDATTDWPRVHTIMLARHGGFAAFGLLADPAWWLATAILMAFATIGFEIIFVLCLVTGLMLIFQSFR
jgi:hypothetical protein